MKFGCGSNKWLKAAWVISGSPCWEFEFLMIALKKKHWQSRRVIGSIRNSLISEPNCLGKILPCLNSVSRFDSLEGKCRFCIFIVCKYRNFSYDKLIMKFVVVIGQYNVLFHKFTFWQDFLFSNTCNLHNHILNV